MQMPPKTAPVEGFLCTHDREERLILLVHRFPCIFDIRLSEYKNKDIQSNAFSEIAKALYCSKYSLRCSVAGWV